MATCRIMILSHTIIGLASSYTIGQLCLLSVLHTMFLYWSVAFPFSYRQFKNSGRVRYTHVAIVVLAIVLPLPAPLVHLKDGYRTVGTPAITCVGSNLDYNFYALIIPVCITIGINTCLLILTMWTIFKVQ